MLAIENHESVTLSTTWSTANRTGRVADRLFNNLLQTHAELHNEFYNAEQVEEHKSIFADLLNFLVDNSANPALVDEFIGEFLKEHKQFAELAPSYLEPLGTVLLTTFKQCFAHQGKVFEKDQQGVWIKVYVYVANAILEFVESSRGEDEEEEKAKNSSTESLSQTPSPVMRSEFSSQEDVSSSYSQEDSEVQPLNIRKTEPEAESKSEDGDDKENTLGDVEEETQKETNAPVLLAPIARTPFTVTKSSDVPSEPITMPGTEASSGKAISFSLSSNEKYRGFRRSMKVSAEPVTVTVPPAFKSNISSSLSSMLSSTSLSTVYNTPPETPFDPRRRKSVRSVDSTPTQSAMQSPLQSCASSIVDDDIPVRRRPSMSTATINDEFVDVATLHSQESEELRSHSRPRSLLHKLKTTPVVESASSDDDEEEEVKQKEADKAPKFDPRRCHRRTHSVNSFDEEDELVFKQEQSPKSFDMGSFSMRGLAPIVEMEDVEDAASSTYSNSNYGEENSADIDSSSNSTLSLHNSDYRSSISSGTEPNLDGFRKTRVDSHMRYPSVTCSEISSIAPYKTGSDIVSSKSRSPVDEVMHTRASSAMYTHGSGSTSSLLVPRNSSAPRASLGFMRSSFVLKKEMETLGYNKPENVFAKPPTLPAAKEEPNYAPPKSPVDEVAATPKSNFSDEDCFDMLNAFEMTHISKETKPKTPRRKMTIHSTLSSGRLSSNDVHASLKMKEKSSFRRKLSSIFGSSTNLDMYANKSASASTRSFSRKSSFVGTIGSGSKHQTPSILSEATGKHPQILGYGYSNFSSADVASIATEESMSGFSFMNSSVRTGSHMRTPRNKMKYDVRDTPFKLFSRS